MTKINKRYYFDTSAFLKFYKDEEGSLNIKRLVSRVSNPIILSSLTILELVSVLMKYYRKGYLNKKTIRSVVKRVRRDTGIKSTTRPFTMIAIPNNSFKRAESILIKYASQYNVGSNDVLHLAAVENAQLEFNDVTFVTSDVSLQHVCNKIEILYYDPEKEKYNYNKSK